MLSLKQPTKAKPLAAAGAGAGLLLPTTYTVVASVPPQSPVGALLHLSEQSVLTPRLLARVMSLPALQCSSNTESGIGVPKAPS
jgi:hypothetical protein